MRKKKLGPTSVCVYISFLVLGFAQLFPLYLCLRSDGGSRLLARRTDSTGTDRPAGEPPSGCSTGESRRPVSRLGSTDERTNKEGIE